MPPMPHPGGDAFPFPTSSTATPAFPASSSGAGFPKPSSLPLLPDTLGQGWWVPPVFRAGVPSTAAAAGADAGDVMRRTSVPTADGDVGHLSVALSGMMPGEGDDDIDVATPLPHEVASKKRCREADSDATASPALSLVSVGPPPRLILRPMSAFNPSVFMGGEASVSPLVEAPRKRVRVRRQRVAFSPTTKPHDGLSAPTRLVDELVWRACVGPQLENGKELLEAVDQVGRQHLPAVRKLLEDLHARLMALSSTAPTAGEASIPVLPRGGGTNAKLQASHLPNLSRLRVLVDRVSAYLQLSAAGVQAIKTVPSPMAAACTRTPTEPCCS